jgi:hypothetical protein
MAGIKEELIIGLLLLAKLAAEFAKGLIGGGACDGKALDPVKWLEGSLKGAAVEPLKLFLLFA